MAMRIGLNVNRECVADRELGKKPPNHVGDAKSNIQRSDEMRGGCGKTAKPQTANFRLLLNRKPRVFALYSKKGGFYREKHNLARCISREAKVAARASLY
jgi:hypothetical protein